MALLPPSVTGPLSECSSSVRVKGQVTGATVDLFSNGAHVGSGVATWSDQVFALNPNVSLAAGASVTATQKLGPDVSVPSTLPVVVQKKPQEIGNVGCKTHIYACGQCLWLDGMVPGATVELKVNNVLRGSGRADDGTARIGLSQPTGPNDVLMAQQTACGAPGMATPLPPPDPPPAKPEGKLPAATVGSPLKECQRAVTVSNVFEGSRVTLTRSAAPPQASCFDLSSLWFPVPPLQVGESVKARQEYPGCKPEPIPRRSSSDRPSPFHLPPSSPRFVPPQ
jgi:hypothetical protein